MREIRYMTKKKKGKEKQIPENKYTEDKGNGFIRQRL